MDKKLFLLGLFIIFSLSCFAQESIELGEIVITPLKTATKRCYQEIHLEILDEDELIYKNLITAGESLNFLESIDVVGGGRLGSSSQGIYIRGAHPRHTTYMFEGIKIYDPSVTSAYYAPYDFLIDDLKKVEVVKFPLSSLYGSSPIGGIINFFVKKPKETPYVSIETEAGSHYTYKESLELGGKLNNLSYLFHLSRLDTKGISKAREKNNNPEKDPYRNTNITLNLNYAESEDIELGLVMKGIDSYTELDDDDNSDGLPEDDEDNMSWNNELFSTLYLKKKISPYLDYKIQCGLTSVYRKYQDDTDEYTRSWYKGKTYQFLNHLEIQPLDIYKILVGFDYTREKMDSYLFTIGNFGPFESDFPKKTSYTKGLFIEQIINLWDRFELDFSYRKEEHHIFKDHTVVKTGITYPLFKDTNIYFSYGEGFKAPSLYQLYNPSSGNTDLKPEESKTWEVGFTHSFEDNLSFSFTYFHSNLKNLIDFVVINLQTFEGRYLNAAKAKTRGIELKINYNLHENLSIESGYSYLEGEQDFVDEDFVTVFGHSLIRVPTHKTFLKIGWKTERFKAYFDFLYSGRRFDRIWVGSVDEFVTMKPYFLGNLAFEYQMNDNSAFFFKIINIFNQNYERIKGYQEEKSSLYGGIKIKF